MVTRLKDSEGNPITPANYCSGCGFVYKVVRTPHCFKYVYSGNFEKPYKRLINRISQTFTPLKGDLEIKVMTIFNMLNNNPTPSDSLSPKKI